MKRMKDKGGEIRKENHEFCRKLRNIINKPWSMMDRVERGGNEAPTKQADLEDQ